MNFYLLVEGLRDEPRVYSEWLKQNFPMMSQVEELKYIVHDHFFIFASHGQPHVTQRIAASLKDIVDHGHIDRFFVCLDAEGLTYDERFRRVQQAVHEAMIETKIKTLMPNFREHIIIQNVCIETWFLGNIKIMETASSHPEAKLLQEFYDVASNDPEDLPGDPRFTKRAQFHSHYLRHVLHAYRKKFPGIAKDLAYTQALRDRCAQTNHLRSLQRLFDILTDP